MHPASQISMTFLPLSQVEQHTITRARRGMTSRMLRGHALVQTPHPVQRDGSTLTSPLRRYRASKGSLPGTEQGGRRAGRHALIFKAHGNLALDFFTAAEGYLRFHGRNDFPGKIADLDAGFLASGDAKPCRDIRIGNNGLGIVFASGKTAAATVGAGQYFHHSLYSGVFFNGENF